jgi:uncharacterized protein GlcG (DUF336 family)
VDQRHSGSKACPIEGTIDMGGGIPIFAGKEVIGAIAVSGAPAGIRMKRALKPVWPRWRIN